jgi:MAE_28990/MAE_18760-like HEPN
MNIEQLIAEIEFDLEWRSEEIRFLRNVVARLDDNEERMRMRRALIVMLYAHFEGFSKFAFQVYVKQINASKCRGEEVVYPILAASVMKEIKGLNNLNQKADIFRNDAPADTELHLLARSIEFVERLAEIAAREIVLNEDDVVNTESNLTPVVMKKILFRLGFGYDDLASVAGSIQKLLGLRNGIAHGKIKEGLEDENYESIQRDVFALINTVKRKVSEAIINTAYLKGAA